MLTRDPGLAHTETSDDNPSKPTYQVQVHVHCPLSIVHVHVLHCMAFSLHGCLESISSSVCPLLRVASLLPARSFSACTALLLSHGLRSSLTSVYALWRARTEMRRIFVPCVSSGVLRQLCLPCVTLPACQLSLRTGPRTFARGVSMDHAVTEKAPGAGASMTKNRA